MFAHAVVHGRERREIIAALPGMASPFVGQCRVQQREPLVMRSARAVQRTVKALVEFGQGALHFGGLAQLFVAQLLQFVPG
jgi:hypothetical protein